MTKIKIALVIVVLAGLLGLAYFAVPQKNGAVPAISASPVFAASFKDMDDKLQPMEQWRGKVMVLNFWAPWCPPCREEMPDFIKLQEQYRDRGLVIVGVALDEKLKVHAFADDIGVNYPILLGEMDAIELAKKLGNRLGGLPFTVVIDRKGDVVSSAVGGVTRARLEKEIAPLL